MNTNKITAILKDLGIPANLLGYHYLRYGIELMMDDVSYINGIVKKLYPKIAEKFETTPTRVERAMRHAIETSWEKGSPYLTDRIFSCSVKEGDNPTNSEFICTVADYLMLEESGEGKEDEKNG